MYEVGTYEECPISNIYALISIFHTISNRQFYCKLFIADNFFENVDVSNSKFERVGIGSFSVILMFIGTKYNSP